MTVHFEFSNNNWQSLEARAFAEELRKSLPGVRDRICKQFGLSLGFDAEGIKVDYDGRKIGFGNFSNKDTSVTFSIDPKVEDFDVRALFTCIDSLSFYNKIVHLNGGSNAEVHEEKNDIFSWTFLLGLLDEINEFGVHHFLIFNSKKILKGRSSIIGRPIAKSLVTNLAMGRFGVDCEVLDNYRQRQYATLFFQTAKSISKDLSQWQSVMKRSDVNLKGTYNSISSKLKQFSDIPFSPRLILELAHPPYPYGVKKLMMQCVRYWKWKGIFASNNSMNVSSFWSVSVALDFAFELYAGHMMKNMLPQSFKAPKQKYPYSFNFDDSRCPEGRINREIEPDHIFRITGTDHLVIAEIKYSNQMAVREHVAQLLAYLKYDLYPFPTQKRTGFLIYPGRTLAIKKIPCFDVDIYMLTLPAIETYISNPPKLDLKLLLT